MNIAPLAKVRHRPVALLTPGHRSLLVTTENGTRSHRSLDQCWTALEKLNKHVCYVDGRLLAMLATTGSDTWTATCWRGRATSLVLDGTTTKVLSLRGTLDQAPATFDELLRFRDWLKGHDVAMGSMSAMGWNLWRRSLDRPLTLAFDPEVGRAALFGGRQEAAEPRTYRHMVAWDIRGAYVYAMSEMGPYASRLRRVSPSTRLDPNGCGIARATVVVPTDLPHPPLPARVADSVVQWQRGRVDGTWPWRELRMASDLGCDVRVRECFAPIVEVHPFFQWHALVDEGRRLAGGAAQLVKAIANSLWGTFGMTGDHRSRVRWQDALGDRPIAVGSLERRMPHASTAHIAAETSSRVRVRLALEGLYGTTGRIVHVDTDGIIIGRNRVHPDEGEGLGCWRAKRSMRQVEIRAPQVYRYKDDCDRCWAATHWHYVVSGTPLSSAPELFARMSHPSRVAVLGTEMVLPPGHSGDLNVASLVAEGNANRHQLFGEPLPC